VTDPAASGDTILIERFGYGACAVAAHGQEQH